jgi:copper(I)-binding protein
MTGHSPRCCMLAVAVAILSSCISRAALGDEARSPTRPIVAETTRAQTHMDHNGSDEAIKPVSESDKSGTYRVGDLVVTAPWSRATPGGAKIAGGYLKITNNGTSVDRLLGTTVDFADHVEIHEMSMADGVMKMRPLTNGLEINPGQTVELKPGGFHMMFVDLKQPLKRGDTRQATLKFEKAGSLNVSVRVYAVGATNGESHDHH